MAAAQQPILPASSSPSPPSWSSSTVRRGSSSSSMTATCAAGRRATSETTRSSSDATTGARPGSGRDPRAGDGASLTTATSTTPSTLPRTRLRPSEPWVLELRPIELRRSPTRESIGSFRDAPLCRRRTRGDVFVHRWRRHWLGGDGDPGVTATLAALALVATAGCVAARRCAPRADGVPAGAERRQRLSGSVPGASGTGCRCPRAAPRRCCSPLRARARSITRRRRWWRCSSS